MTIWAWLAGHGWLRDKMHDYAASAWLAAYERQRYERDRSKITCS